LLLASLTTLMFVSADSSSVFADDPVPPARFFHPNQASRIPRQDVLRPPRARAPRGYRPTVEEASRLDRASLKFLRRTVSKPLHWHLDHQPQDSAPDAMRQVSGNSGFGNPIRLVAGEKDLKLAPAANSRDASPTNDPRPLKTALLPRRLPRSTDLQPAETDGEGSADFKCPERADLIRSITELTIDITPSMGYLPEECPLYADDFRLRYWCDTIFAWKASCLCHKPLYFEQMPLERYGHVWGHHLSPIIGPVISGAHFFATIPVLPYKMGLEDPCECIYALGYYRPGNCAPKLIYPIPLSLRGALYEAGAITGLVFLLP